MIELCRVSPKSSIREWLSRMLVKMLSPFYFFARRKRLAWNLDFEKLAKMPEASLGHDLHLFLLKNNFSLIAKAETQDVFHALFGYDATMKGEIGLQMFLMGNGKKTPPVVATNFVSFCLYPEYWEFSIHCYKMGKCANHFYSWPFDKLLHVPSAQLRKMIFEEREAGFY